MDADPPLDYLLDPADGRPPSADELRAIVARSRGRREHWLVAGMAATLAIGGLGGWLVASRRSPAGGGTTLAAEMPAAAGAGSGAASVPPSAAAAAPTLGIGTPCTPYTLSFTRTTADGVTIRVYQVPSSAPQVVRGPTGCSVLTDGPLVAL